MNVPVPDRGAWLVTDGEVRRVVNRWTDAGPTHDGRIRWYLVTQDDRDSPGTGPSAPGRPLE